MFFSLSGIPQTARERKATGESGSQLTQTPWGCLYICTQMPAELGKVGRIPRTDPSLGNEIGNCM